MESWFIMVIGNNIIGLICFNSIGLEICFDKWMIICLDIFIFFCRLVKVVS